MNVIGIKFKDNGKTYYFKAESFQLKKGDQVVVETEKGEQLAKVTEVDVKDLKKLDINKMKSVLRTSTDKDYEQYLNNLKKAQEALETARKLVESLKLDMRVLDASYTLDRNQLTLNFTADERVDFRDLVKELASKFHTRIELHQIGVRDKAKEIGGLGPCGRPLCCNGFMSCMETISINMAKNQNIALNPSKINGACGRLLCCLAYEDEVYTCHRKKMPKMNQMVKTPDGEGRVVALDVLNKKYTVEIDGDKKTYDSE